MWIAGATGAEAVQRGTVLILVGIPVYVVTERTNASGAVVPCADPTVKRWEVASGAIDNGDAKR